MKSKIGLSCVTKFNKSDTINKDLIIGVNVDLNQFGVNGGVLWGCDHGGVNGFRHGSAWNVLS